MVINGQIILTARFSRDLFPFNHAIRAARKRRRRERKREAKPTSVYARLSGGLIVAHGE